MTAAHVLTMEVRDEPRMFRAVCSCGNYIGAWETTNACMGRGRLHVAAMRRRELNTQTPSPSLDPRLGTAAGTTPGRAQTIPQVEQTPRSRKPRRPAAPGRELNPGGAS